MTTHIKNRFKELVVCSASKSTKSTESTTQTYIIFIFIMLVWSGAISKMHFNHTKTGNDPKVQTNLL